MSKRSATTFGWAEAEVESALYRDGVSLGKGLAERGFSIRCGGYLGLMEAVAAGAASVGGECEGVTLETFGSKPANRFVTAEHKERDLYDRLRKLIDDTELYVAQVGSLGTVTEVVLTWCLSYLGVAGIGNLHLIGSEWQPLVEAFEALQVREDDRKRAVIHESVEAFFQEIDRTSSPYEADAVDTSIRAEPLSFEQALEDLYEGLRGGEALSHLVNRLGSHAPDYFQHSRLGGLELQQIPQEIAELLDHLLQHFSGRQNLRYLEVGVGSCGTLILADAVLSAAGHSMELFGVDDLSYERSGWLTSQTERIDWCTKNLGLALLVGSLADESTREQAASRCYDIIFVDADHSLAGCLNDVMTVLPWLAPEGVLVLHDIADDEAPGVAATYQFVRSYFGSSQEFVSSSTCGIAALTDQQLKPRHADALHYIASHIR